MLKVIHIKKKNQDYPKESEVKRARLTGIAVLIIRGMYENETPFFFQSYQIGKLLELVNTEC